MVWACGGPRCPPPRSARSGCGRRSRCAAAATSWNGPLREPSSIGAAGDIACEPPPDPTDPEACQYDDTADLLAGLAGVLVLGDSQYEARGYEAFQRYYRPTWGRFRSQTFPVPGNHEYTQDPRSAPNGYFRLLR